MSTLLTALGLYYVMTGVWPLLHERSFAAVTGPKHDWWLVKQVGLLSMTSGFVYLFTSWGRTEVPPEISLLILLNALSFATVDICYVIRRRISRIYLVDATVQLAVLLLMSFRLVR
jgi:hypothetical protein